MGDLYDEELMFTEDEERYCQRCDLYLMPEEDYLCEYCAEEMEMELKLDG